MHDGTNHNGAIKKFDFSQFRERDWQNVLTCHEQNDQDNNKPFLWSYANHSISKIPVETSASLTSSVSSVAVSQCGNFGILGF